jgi:uncharacterized protein (TIGR02996 family)
MRGMGDVTRDELVNAIAAAPDDPTPRLVLADWLQDRGDPWGELLALQNRPPSDVGAARLAALHADTRWLGPLHDEFIRWRFERGAPVRFGNKGVFGHGFPDPKYVASYVFELRFRVSGEVHGEFWETTDREPTWRETGTYELDSLEALRGRGRIPLRVQFRGREHRGVMAGAEMTLDGMEALESPEGAVITLRLEQLKK